uniref:TRAF-interacting protein n=1 Tax=Lygus hesperus TaxID=30085 RepID=A0A146KRJ2_LYGHE
MNVQCVICKDVVDVLKAGHEGFKASALSCGHVFHTDCIHRWLDQSGSANQGTCPQCRCVVMKKKALRLFFDLVPMENYQDDPTVIKANNDLLKKDIEDLRDRMATKTQITDKLTKMNSGLRERVLELEQKLVLAQQNTDALKMTRIKLNKKSKELEDTKDEMEKLRQKVTSLRASNTILNGSLKDEEAREALEALEKSDMALLFFSYKKDSEQLLKRVGMMSSDLSRSQEEARKLRKELTEARDEISVLNRIVEVYHKPKLKAPEPNSGAPSTSSSSSDLSPVRMQPGPTTTTPQVITPHKRKLIPQSSHPYKIPKKSSVLSSIAHGSQLAGAPAKSLTVPESYDGLGGHSRLDDFPKMKTALKKPLKIVSDRKPTSVFKHPSRL